MKVLLIFSNLVTFIEINENNNKIKINNEMKQNKIINK